MWKFFRRPWAVVTTIAVFFSAIAAWNAAWAFRDIGGVQLTDNELDQYRGGYAGFYFGISFTGFLSNQGMASGSIGFGGQIVNDPNFQLPPGGQFSGGVTGDGVSIQAFVGNFSGASGIFQIIQSPGSYNVIQNNLLVQITMINVTNAAAVSQLSGFLPWR
jgi:hypothetical protein